MKVRYSADLPSPVGLEKLQRVASWCETLDDIPASKIDLYYQKTAREKTNGFPPNAYDIRATWNKYTDQRRWAAMIDDPNY